MIHPFTQTAATMRTYVTLALILAFWLPPFGISTGLAQENTAITPTTGVGSLGTTVMADGNTIQITGGTRPDDGTNLFHSFDQFSVGRPDTAQFLNTTPSLHTSTILGRVTGGSPSGLFGTIDTMSYPGANLFLMNPNGIVFGPNATLHVDGLVAFTTANYLRLAEADGSNAGIFHAETTSTSLLTSASVAAFGFLGSNPAAIAVQGSTLEIQPGQSISLVGGNQGFKNPDTGSTSVPNGVTVIGGKLLAGNGQVNIASVASPGEVMAGTLEYAPNINGQSFGGLGTIEILQQSGIDTSGEGGGTILIRGGRLVVDDSTISANTKTVGPDTGLEAGPSETGIDIQVAQEAIIDNGSIIETNVIRPIAQDRGSGGVRITADHIEISGGPKIIAILETNPETIPFAGIRSNVEPGGTAARSGDISLDATSIRIKDLGQIETQTANTGDAGHIALKATGNIDTDFTRVQSISENSSGHAGNITFSSSQGDVSLTKTIVTSQTSNSSGNAGNITINALHGNILLAGTEVFNAIGIDGTGTLGGIQIKAHDLDLRDGTLMGGDNFAKQVAENIVIMLDGRLALSGGSGIETGALGSADAADLIISAPDILIAEQSMLFTGTISSGDGGRLSLFTDNLQLADGGTLSSKSFIGSEGEIPSGSGGVISIQGLRSPGTSVTIDGPGSGIFTTTEGTGPGGGLDLSAQSLTIQNGGTISASTSGTATSATGGSIAVNTTDHVTVTDGASISASSTGPSNAGNIRINAGQTFVATNSNRAVTTGADAASGGTITLLATDTVQLTNSRISASVADGPGGGGDITIDPQYVILQNSQILAQTADGQGGAITITTNLFLPDATSLVNADSGRPGLNGTVTIQSPNSPASGKIQPLGNQPLEATSLLNQRCAALADGDFSSFTVAGRDILPAEPGTWLASPLATLSAGTGRVGKAEGVKGKGERSVARGEGRESMTMRASSADERTLLSLRQMAPAGFLTQAFAVDWSAGCQS